ncbi:MAG: hypothetical protein EG826_13925, partial [Deltaproteobacteria bacterium]|nr:hypothetical protein [Deltaproteobacteria bacterium]
MRKIIAKRNIGEAEPVRNLLDLIGKALPIIDVRGLTGTARPFVTALMFDRMAGPITVLCPTPREAAAFARDLGLFLGQEAVLHYPPLDFLSIDMFALQREEELARLNVLTQLQVDSRKVIVTCLAACLQKVMPLAEFRQYLKVLSTGDILLMEEFPAKLQAGGYQRVSLVENAGEFSLRGNILDIFPPTESEPLRLEMAGDEIESIRHFDSTSQRSGAPVGAFVLGPAGEILIDEMRLNRAVRNVKRRADDLDLPRDLRNRLSETLRQQSATSVNPIFLPLFYEDYDDRGSLGEQRLSSVFDYLPQNTLLILDDPLAIDQAAQSSAASIDKLLYKAKSAGKFYLENAGVYVTDEALHDRLAEFRQIHLSGLTLDGGADETPRVTLTSHPDVPVAEPLAGEVKEEALLRHTADKI